MSIKEIKKFLSRSYKMEKRINSKLEQLKTLKDLIEKVTISFSGMPKNSTKNIHASEETIGKLIDLEMKISKDLSDLVKIKKEIINFINDIENKEFQMILELRYVCHKNWNEIANEMNFAMSNIFKLHSKALKFLSDFKTL